MGLTRVALVVCPALTLRGTYTLDDGSIGTMTNILDYISPDRTRAWRLTGAWLWPTMVTR